jgi:hypothetical protein
MEHRLRMRRFRRIRGSASSDDSQKLAA